MKTVGLALGGGGARGIAIIPYLKVLDELGIKPVIISGTSIGAIIGAFYAAGFKGAQIEKIFLDLNLKELIKLVDLSWWSKSGLVKGEKVAKKWGELLGVVNFEELKIKFKVVAVDYYSQKEVILNKGHIVSAVHASAAIPGFFNPVYIGHMVLMDGGVTNPVPFDIIRNDCDYLIAIDILKDDSFKINISKKPAAIDLLQSTFRLSQISIIENKLRYVKPDLYVNPKLGNIGLFDFHKSKEILKKSGPDLAHFRQQLIYDLHLAM
jgi:NTE family protein